MGYSDPKIIVSTNWLAEHQSDPNLRILDGSWYLPTDNRDPLAEFHSSHIDGAQFFDIDGISDASSNLPHMVPSEEQFAQQVADLGISNDSQIVVYDTHGLFSAARVWWLCRYFGLENIAVLDGGLPKWKSEGHPTSNAIIEVVSGNINTHASVNNLRVAADLLGASTSGSAQIIDARPSARFKGEVPEPRAGLRSGHIPNSKNVFFKLLLNANGTMKTNTELTAVFQDQGIDQPNRLSLLVVRALLRRYCRWLYRKLATQITRSMMAHGQNGAHLLIIPWNRVKTQKEISCSTI